MRIMESVVSIHSEVPFSRVKCFFVAVVALMGRTPGFSRSAWIGTRRLRLGLLASAVRSSLLGHLYFPPLAWKAAGGKVTVLLVWIIQPWGIVYLIIPLLRGACKAGWILLHGPTRPHLRSGTKMPRTHDWYWIVLSEKLFSDILILREFLRFMKRMGCLQKDTIYLDVTERCLELLKIVKSIQDKQKQ